MERTARTSLPAGAAASLAPGTVPPPPAVPADGGRLGRTAALDQPEAPGHPGPNATSLMKGEANAPPTNREAEPTASLIASALPTIRSTRSTSRPAS